MSNNIQNQRGNSYTDFYMARLAPSRRRPRHIHHSDVARERTCEACRGILVDSLARERLMILAVRSLQGIVID
jgi:hypothetical protein